MKKLLILCLFLVSCYRPTPEMRKMIIGTQMAERIIYFKDSKDNCFAGIESIAEYDNIASITYVPKENCK